MLASIRSGPISVPFDMNKLKSAGRQSKFQFICRRCCFTYTSIPFGSSNGSARARVSLLIHIIGGYILCSLFILTRWNSMWLTFCGSLWSNEKKVASPHLTYRHHTDRPGTFRSKTKNKSKITNNYHRLWWAIFTWWLSLPHFLLRFCLVFVTF